MKKIENIIALFPESDRQIAEIKLLGLECNDKYVIARISRRPNQNITNIAVYERKIKKYQTLLSKKERLNIIQASVNSNNNLIAFVTKDRQNNIYNENENNSTKPFYSSKNTYTVNVINVKTNATISELNLSSEKQIMAQFLYRKKVNNFDRLLVFIHQKGISLYELDSNETKIKTVEVVTHSFSWAQWDAAHQCLFYIHYKRLTRREEESTAQNEQILTLSAFQFHDDMPHETVLNVPLNLPQATEYSTSNIQTDVYDDIPIPLCIRDCALNVLILMQSTGIVYVCNYYFYQPVVNSDNSSNYFASSNNSIHFAYSVTVLHHGSIVHCSLSEIDWNKTLDLKPVFCMYGEQHLIVQVSDLYTHVLDVGIDHEPCCHFVIFGSPRMQNTANMVPVPGVTTETIDLKTLDLFKVTITKTQLLRSYLDENSSVDNKLSILHYLLTHLNDIETVCLIVSKFGEKLNDIDLVKFLKEILVAGCYASVHRYVSADSSDLLRLLPLTTVHSGTIDEKKKNKFALRLEQEMLCNPSVMLLTPRQRLIPFRSDIWTRLWNHLPNHILTDSQTSRFKNSQVVDKLSVSLTCYQPEALSRCCTPLSPGAPHMASTGMLAEVANASRSNKLGTNPLPFFEVEASAASKQEHVISVNLREISLHLVKLGKSPMQVHAVAMRYASSQLEISKIVCSFLTQAAGIDTKRGERGFPLIDHQLSKSQRHILFALFERYYLAVDTMAFPIPQGFTSFFAYLGYRVLPISKFIDYVRANVLQVNIDVMKVIMSDLSDKDEDLKHKMNILIQLPRSRVKRVLNQWSHPVSLMLRAREHCLNILSGIVGTQPTASASSKGVRRGAAGVSFPPSERSSPLNTFLDLLTAKANLAEIDFNLLIEATITSTEIFQLDNE